MKDNVIYTCINTHNGPNMSFKMRSYITQKTWDIALMCPNNKLKMRMFALQYIFDIKLGFALYSNHIILF